MLVAMGDLIGDAAGALLDAGGEGAPRPESPADWACSRNGCAKVVPYVWVAGPNIWQAEDGGRVVKAGELCATCRAVKKREGDRQQRGGAVYGALPPEFRQAWPTHLAPGLQSHVLQWLNNREDWCLCLFGKPGRGKSYAAAATMAYAHVQCGMEFAWHFVPEWCGALAEGSKNGRDPAARLVYQRGVLVLDDLAAENPTPARVDALYRIINRRMEERRRTIITANATLETLEAFYGHSGPRIASRLAGHVITASGADRRQGGGIAI